MKLIYLFNKAIISEKASLVQVVHMCDAFASNGVDVELALPYNKKQTSFPEDYLTERFGVKNKFKLSFFNKIMLFNRLDTLGTYFGVSNFLSKSNTDIYFTRCPMIFTILAGKELPVIYEAHNAVMHNESEAYNSFWVNKVIKASRKSNCLSFITISGNLGNHWLKKGVPQEKLLVLHDGFDMEMFKDSVGKIQARLNLHLPLNKKIVTYTGSLYPDREIENIINLADYFPDVIFYVVGGPQTNADHYKSKAKEDNITNIRFTGPLEHSKIPFYLYASDVLLALWSKKVPTINYCSPLKIFEYMAAGRTIVAHSFTTIKEVIRHKENGLLIDPNNFSDLVSKTRIALYDTSLNGMGNQAKEEAFDRYPWNKRAAKIVAIIKTKLASSF